MPYRSAVGWLSVETSGSLTRGFMFKQYGILGCLARGIWMMCRGGKYKYGDFYPEMNSRLLFNPMPL